MDTSNTWTNTTNIDIFMNFEFYLKEQIEKHPSMQPQDVVKMCFQAAYGAEHMLSDIGGAWNYLKKEYAGVTPSDGELFEPISDKYCRVNLSAWKSNGLSLEKLFYMFTDSCRIENDADARFERCLEAVPEVIGSTDTSFTAREWESFLTEYREGGISAVHHSDTYREREKPAYRLVERRFCESLA